MFSKVILLGFAAANTAKAASVTQDWTLQAQAIQPDGFPRTAALINGVYPGPLVKANKGDTITINVNNQLNDNSMRKSTSIVSSLPQISPLLYDSLRSKALAWNCEFTLKFIRLLSVDSRKSVPT